MKKKLLFTLFSFLLITATAADVNLSGACLDAGITLTQGADANGKPSYSGMGMVSSNPVLFAIVWEPLFLPSGGWVLYGSGTPLFSNLDNTSLPPATGVGTWSAAPGDPCLPTAPNISGPGTLPVELIYFNASVRDDQVHLVWATASEFNNKGFEIQRSKNANPQSALSWESMGFIQGNGTSIEVQEYVFVDKSPRDGYNYYRLKQLDLDGQFEYTSIRQVFIRKQQDVLMIYPNPVSEVMNIYMPADVVNAENTLDILLHTVSGQLIKHWSTDDGKQELDMSIFPSGLYLLKVQSGLNTWFQKVVIE